MSQVLYGVISFCKIMLGFLIFVRIFPEKRWKQRWAGILGWCILVVWAVENAWDSCRGFIPWLQIIIYGILNEMFMLRIRNTCLDKPKRKENRLVTTKDDTIYHGWGTANVKQIVESAGDEIEYTCEGNWFEVNILI